MITVRDILTQELIRLHRTVCAEWCGGDPGGAACDGNCRSPENIRGMLAEFREEILRDAAQYLRDAAQYGDVDVYTLADVIDPDVDVAGYVRLRDGRQ